MSRRRLLIASIVTVLVFGSAGLAVAGGRHSGGSRAFWADRPAPANPWGYWKDRESLPEASEAAPSGDSVPGTDGEPADPGTDGEPADDAPAEPGAKEPGPSQPSAPDDGSWWRPTVGTTWQWQLTGELDLSVEAQVFDVDLFDVSASDVAAIHAKGAKAVCYVETGAWEDYRPDASSYPSSVLGTMIDGYPDERYVDIRQLDVLRPIIDARLDMCAKKGFDGVEPDIDDSFIDVGAAGIGFPVSYADQLAFNRMVAADAHARGLAIGLKNGTYGDYDQTAQFVKDMQPSVDFTVNEGCVESEVCGILTVFPDNGKPVFHTEYVDGDWHASTSDYDGTLAAICPVTRPLRFSSILKDASEVLSAWRQVCP